MAHPQAAVPHIRAGGRGGSVIITSSGAALMPPPGIDHYNASKAGVVALGAPSPRRSGSNPIRVNCVNPGNVDTPMIDNEVTRRLFLPHLEHPTREDAEKPDSTYVAVNVLPVPWVSPGDVSNVVTFLASDASEHLTGTPHPRRCRLPDQEMTQIRPVVGQGCSQARRTTARRETTQ